MSNPYSSLRRFSEIKKTPEMPPGHGKFWERLAFERRYINKQTRGAISSELSLEAMRASQNLCK